MTDELETLQVSSVEIINGIESKSYKKRIKGVGMPSLANDG